MARPKAGMTYSSPAWFAAPSATPNTAPLHDLGASTLVVRDQQLQPGVGGTGLWGPVERCCLASVTIQRTAPLWRSLPSWRAIAVIPHEEIGPTVARPRTDAAVNHSETVARWTDGSLDGSPRRAGAALAVRSGVPAPPDTGPGPSSVSGQVARL